MPPSYQVCLSVIFNLGHSRRNQRRVVTVAMDRHRGTVTWLMRHTRLDPVGVYYKLSPFKLPNPSFHPHSFIIPPITLSFKLPQSLPLSTDHCPPNILQSPKSYNLQVGIASVGVFLVTEYFPILFFSNSMACVPNFYLFILHFCLLVSISLVLSHILFLLYDLSDLG